MESYGTNLCIFKDTHMKLGTHLNIFGIISDILWQELRICCEFLPVFNVELDNVQV